MPPQRIIPRVCETCGVDFFATKGNVERGWGRFCSALCRGGPRPIIEYLGGDCARLPLYARDGSIRAHILVDAADAAWIAQWRWKYKEGYAVRGSIRLHREILGLPRTFDGRQGDHINRNRLDCRRENLRILPDGKNQQNIPDVREGYSSKYRGVYWATDLQRWRAAVKVNGRTTYVGTFKSEADAAAAAKDARARLLPYAVD